MGSLRTGYLGRSTLRGVEREDTSDRRKTEPPELRDNICWLLSQASWVVASELSVALAGVGLSSRKHQLLTMAATAELTQIELARVVGLDKTTMVVTLDELEAEGLAVRQRSPKDRRARIVAVTDLGRARLVAAEDLLIAVREQVLAEVPEEARNLLLGALRSIVSLRAADETPNVRPARRREPRPRRTDTALSAGELA